MDFLERFKGKISSINKQGNIESSNGMMIPTVCCKPPLPIRKLPKLPTNIDFHNNRIGKELNDTSFESLCSEISSNISQNKNSDIITRKNPKCVPRSLNLDKRNETSSVEKSNIRNIAYQQLRPLNYGIPTTNDSIHRSSSMNHNGGYTNGWKESKYYKLGGLGANIGGKDWMVKREKQARMTEYGKAIMNINRVRSITAGNRPPLPRSQLSNNENEAKLRKNKMLEYAKHIPKPKQSRINYLCLEKINTEELNELERLDQHHKEYFKRFNVFANKFD